jgi:multicomponent Na+:H+ antiporter subunit E
MKPNRIKRNSSFFFLGMLLLWVSLAGTLRIDELVVGVAAVLLVVVISHHLFFSDEELPKRGLKQVWLWLVLIQHLLVEIVIANIAIAKLVLSRKLDVQPHIFRYHTSLKSPVLKSLFANSITLTPGTLSVDIEGDDIVVHALTNQAQLDLESGSLEAPFLALEEKQ